MTVKQKFGCVFGIVWVSVTGPIWYYLLFQILKSVNASDVMWLLYWVYVPVALLVGVLKAIVESIFDNVE